MAENIETKPPTGASTYSSAISEADNYMRWLLNQFEGYISGRILETGLGHGSYVQFLEEHGTYAGVDIDSDSVANARERNPHHTFFCADLCDESSFSPATVGQFDTILSINVLEHIPRDDLAIQNLVTCLNPGGCLLLNIPALAYLYNDLDRLAGHERRYSTKDLASLLKEQPVEILKLCYFNPIGGLGWWLNRLKTHNDLNDNVVNSQILIFDKYIVPLSKLTDPIFRRFFGQSVTCIARKI